MDCDTTGVEPDFALVKFKKLAGGGYMKIANQSVKPALLALGYKEAQVEEIMRYVLGTMSLQGSAHINRESLKAKGFSETDLDVAERNLPQVFELSFAFNRWTLGEETMKRLGFDPSQYNNFGFDMLRELGFSRDQIEKSNEMICGRMTVEGAPFLKEEHLPVFDCANRCGKIGKRFILPEGHIRMMAASQPFISGSISKTINLPEEATVEDTKKAYLLSWKLGLKANALYRDGSKLSQPLSTKSDAKTENKEVEVREKVVIKEVPRRRKLAEERASITHKFSVAGHEGYLTVGLYEDGKPGEIFIKMAKEGSTLSGVMDTLALSLSMNLQYGVPLEVLVGKLVHTRFEPAGMTTNKEIPFVKSMMDYLGRWLALKFLSKEKAKLVHNAELVERAYAEGSKSREAFVGSLPVLDMGTEEDKGLRTMDRGQTIDSLVLSPKSLVHDSSDLSANTGTPLAFQGAEDSPMCGQCGSTMIRNGACYKCLDCGETSGCS